MKAHEVRDWIIAHDATAGDDAYAVECLRCGAKQRFVVPMSVSVYVAAVRQFEKNHARCREVQDG